VEEAFEVRGGPVWETTQQVSLRNSEAMVNRCYMDAVKTIANDIPFSVPHLATESPINSPTVAPVSSTESPVNSPTAAPMAPAEKPVDAPTAAPFVSSKSSTFPPTVGPTHNMPMDSELEFILYNADEDKPLRKLKEVECMEPFQFNIQVQCKENCPSAHSAYMELSGPRNFTRTENKAPWMIFGDRDGDINGRQYIAGDYKISASLYSERGAEGDLLAKHEFSFTVSRDCDRRRNLRAASMN